MSELLTPDKIAALVDAAKQGNLPDPGQAQTQRRSHRMRTVDFTRPTKFSADLQRRITRASETFCQTANTRLSAELRWPVELEVLNTVQLTWAAAQGQIPPNSLPVLIEVEPIGTRMLMTAERSFVLTALECVLGGSPEQLPRERRLTEIDWSLTRRLFESLVLTLSLVWKELAGVRLTPGEIDPHDASQVASVSEPTYTVLMECRLNKQSFALALLVPWIAIEPISRTIVGHPQSRSNFQLSGEPIRDAMSNVPITLRAEVAAVEMEVTDILALTPGAVIKFGVQAEDGVALFAENTKLARAQPGASGTHRAVQIVGAEGPR